MDDPIYQIEQFPQDGRSWRVDMFGEIDRSSPVPSDPLVEVLMSPVHMDKARELGISSNHTVNHAGRRSFWTNAGYLPLIRISSLWRDGVRIDSPGLPGPEQHPFYELNITPMTARLVPADMLLDKNTREHLIPPSAYRLGGRGLRTQFLSIDHDGIEHRVLIPVLVVGSFYYFGSTQLTKRLLWGLIDDNGGEIFNMARSHSPVDGTGVVHLRQNIPDDDAWIVSRLAHSPIALKRAISIHDSLTVKKANGDPLSPDILPPFVGKTNLVVSGKWIKSGSAWRFLVFWIKSCSHPFPSNHLVYCREPDNRSDGVDDPSRPEINIPAKDRPALRDGDEIVRLRGDTEPRKNLARIESFLHEARFTDLAAKTRDQIIKDKCRFRAGTRPPPEILAIEGWSSGDGTYGESEAGPIGLSVKMDDCPRAEKERKQRPLPHPPSLVAVEQAVLHITTICDASCRFIQVSGEAGHGNATLFPALCAKHPKWPRVDGRRRQVLVAEILYAGGYHYLFEIERGKGEEYTTLYARHRNSGQFDNDALSRILDHGAANKGTWFKKGEMTELAWKKLLHTWTSPSVFATKVLNILGGKTNISDDITHVLDKKGQLNQALQLRGLLARLLPQERPES